jgi:hypothetical protein
MCSRSCFRPAVLPLLAAAAFSIAAAATAQEKDRMNAFEGISVAGAERTEVSRLTDGGVVSLPNASAMVVTVAGELKGRADRNGEVGVLFLPNVPFFDSLFRSRRILLAASEASAAIASGDSSYFVTKPKRLEVGFSSYRLLLFNTTGTAVTANVYVYASRD